MTHIQPYIKPFYWISAILLALAAFGLIPAWPGIVIGVVAFVFSWQIKSEQKAEAKQRVVEANEALDALYRRYAPVLTRDYATDQKTLEKKIIEVRESNPDFANSLADVLDAYITRWEKDYGEPMPHYIMFAILRDFEYIQNFMAMNNSESIATARALIDRFDHFDRWLEITGSPITDEEIEAAHVTLRANTKN